MLDGLIITLDKKVFEEFKNFLSSNQHHFEYAESLEAVEDIFEVDTPDYIFVVEKIPSKLSKLLEKLSKIEHSQKVPVFCFTTSPSHKDRMRMWENGANDIFELPILKTTLKSCLENISRHISPLEPMDSDDGMNGRLEDFNMIQLLQVLEQNEKTGILRLSQAGVKGQIWFYKGEIYDASYKKFENLDALLNLMTWMEGDFSIIFVDEKYEKKIEWDNQQILLEGIQRIDRKNKILKELPPLKDTLLISTEADMERMKEKDVLLLKFFHSGNKIASFLLNFNEDEIFLLEEAETFVKKRYLLTRPEFDSLTAKLEHEVEFSGLAGSFKKIFGKKEATSAKEKEVSKKKGEKTTSVDEENRMPYEHLFQIENKDLSRFRKEIERL